MIVVRVSGGVLGRLSSSSLLKVTLPLCRDKQSLLGKIGDPRNCYSDS